MRYSDAFLRQFIWGILLVYVLAQNHLRDQTVENLQGNLYTNEAIRVFSNTSSTMVSFPSDIEEIRDVLTISGSHAWGWVIYRCTYSDQALWERFMEIFRQTTHQYLADHDGLDLEDTLRWTIFDNKEELDNASVHDIATRFGHWLETEGERERDDRDHEFRDPSRAKFPSIAMVLNNARYEVCIHVDEAALKSVIDDPASNSAYINLVRFPDPPELVRRREEYLRYCEMVGSGGQEEDEDDESWGRFEFGQWMYFYASIMHGMAWYHHRVPPPAIADD